MSGLAAAYQLKQKSLSVLVLEARNRLGGRIQTVTIPNTTNVIDLGAAWIHGIKSSSRGDNPMITVSKRAGLSWHVVTEGLQSFTPTGAPDPDSYYTNMERVSEAWENYYNNVYLESDYEDSDSLQTVTDRYLAVKKPSTADRELLKQWLTTEIVSDYAADLKFMSGPHSFNDLNWGGADAFPAKGFGALTTHLAQGQAINYNHAVTKVDYSKTPVVVSGNKLNPTTGAVVGTFSFQARYVIVTLPLGYLRAQLAPATPTLFAPALPAAQRTAILSLGMGLLNKIILVWDNAWWSSVLKKPWLEFRNATHVGEFSEFYNVAATPAKLPAIVCFNFASQAASFETSMTDAQQVARALAVIRRAIPTSTTMPAPRWTRVTRWNADPWSLGAYSYVRAGAKWNARTTAAAAVGGGRVGFAGEHTHTQFPSTVHGAYLSGIREADRVAKLLGRRRSKD